MLRNSFVSVFIRLLVRARAARLTDTPHPLPAVDWRGHPSQEGNLEGPIAFVLTGSDPRGGSPKLPSREGGLLHVL
jgi:hypothetical protein